MRVAFLLFAAVSLAFAARYPFFGVVLEAETDIPVSRAQIYYASGKEAGKADAQGRFELELESASTKLVFIKDGYDTVTVSLEDFPDPLDAIVLMVPNVRNLGQSTIEGGKVETFEVSREVEMESLEDAAGMRFDLTEHLSQMPGISGQKDFSSKLYYDGSRASDVAYHLGELRVPNMRHLDFGFPGNFSIVNPHVLRGLEFHDDYGEGPLGEGLATSVQYLPEDENTDLSGRVSVATTMFEGDITTPFFIWDALRVNVRMLNEDMLENMGDKFFTEYNKSDEDCSDCTVSSSDPYSLTAYDGFIQLYGSDSTGDSWALRALYSKDEYTVRQDTATRLDEINSVNLIKGEQQYVVVGLEYLSPLGTSWHAGFVREDLADTLRDTTGFRRNATTSDASLIDAYDFSHTTISLGIDYNFGGSIAGSKLSSGLLLDWHMLERSTVDNFGDSDDMNQLVATWVSRLNWEGEKYNASIGAGSVVDMDGNWGPMASLDGERKLSEPLRIFGNVAYRSDWDYTMDYGKFDGTVESGTSAKLGVGYRTKYLDLSAHGYGRFYYDPEMPTPKAYAQYKELTEADYAWVTGASATLEWKTSHHFSMGVNAGSTYGEYELSDREGSLPWEANSRLDMVTHLRYYPRKDSMLSFIVSHHASWHSPLYYYEITYSDDGYGTRRVRDYEDFTDLFRTDIRVNLDFTKHYYFVNRIRFFVEVDNIFANLDVDWLRFLGGENARERSQVTQNVSSDGSEVDLVPLMTKGMGLYVQFGVDIVFGG